MKILNNATQDVEVYGELKQNRVSIDVKNIDFITQILSTNLYSKPLNSFLRETISNAIDSHKEAGTKDPIILDMGKTGDKWYIRVQDFGTGISPERFDAIYRFIGSSTKRESNEYIGAFGVGRMSVLAVSDSATITNRYNGIEYKYLLYKDGMAVNIDEISVKQTSERNGLEVYCQPNIGLNYNQLINAIKELVFFEGLYINNNFNEKYDGYSAYYGYREFSKYVENFNKRKIIHFKTFSCVTAGCVNQQSILLGNVLYEVDYSHLDNNDNIYKSAVAYDEYVVFPRFDIGQISVTPNRENILYNNQSEELINKKSVEVYNEIVELVSSKYGKNLGIDIIGAICDSTFNFQLHKDYPSLQITIGFDIISKVIASKSTIYGKKLNQTQIKNLSDYIKFVDPFYSSHLLKNEKISIKERPLSLADISKKTIAYFSRTEFYRCEFKQLGFYLKQYLKESYSNIAIVKHYNEDEIFSSIKRSSIVRECDKLTLAIYKKLCVDTWNSLPAISDSLITDDFKAQFSRKNAYITENINVSYYENGYFAKQEKDTIGNLLKSGYSYIIFTRAENLVPIDLSSLSGWLIRNDDEFGCDVRFIEVGEKTKKELSSKDGFIDWTKLIGPERYWMRFLKTFDGITKLNWFKDIVQQSGFIKLPPENTKRFLAKFNVYSATYEKIKKTKKYALPFWDKIEPLQDIIDVMKPSQDVLNFISMSYDLKYMSTYDLTALLAASFDNVDVDDKIKEQYQKFVNLYSNKDDKEHNKDQSVPECNT